MSAEHASFVLMSVGIGLWMLITNDYSPWHAMFGRLTLGGIQKKIPPTFYRRLFALGLIVAGLVAFFL
jgi:hypothetical protein